MVVNCMHPSPLVVPLVLVNFVLASGVPYYFRSWPHSPNAARLRWIRRRRRTTLMTTLRPLYVIKFVVFTVIDFS